nr:MAG TPA: Protein trafficking PGA2 [Bacteriophage sp.]
MRIVAIFCSYFFARVRQNLKVSWRNFGVINA